MWRKPIRQAAKRRRLALILGAAALGLQMPTVQAASFPCAQARSAVEKSVCADKELSNLDEYLGRYYAAARSGLGDGAACLVVDQRRWLRDVRDACTSAACLRQVYLQRLSEFDALQPGASALKNIELPSMPQLVWIIPPAKDQVAAPLAKDPPPLVLRGQLLSEIVTGDGFVLRTAQGRKHLVLMNMLIDDSAPLMALVDAPGATYEVRGAASTRHEGKVRFEPSACTFIYRLP